MCHVPHRLAGSSMSCKWSTQKVEFNIVLWRDTCSHACRSHAFQVSGSARVMGALFEALQLGFGMETAQGLVWWAPRVKHACNAASQPVWLQLIL